MNEMQARAWVEREFNVPRETMEKLDLFADLLRAENERQNLVSRGTLDQLWRRHIADSAQLLRFAPAGASWVDLGTGAGFPGLSNEMVERLSSARPPTLGAASRIRGITPAALAAILVHAGRKAA